MEILQVDTSRRREVTRFIDLPFRIYRDSPQWVPLLRVEARLHLNRRKHPFFEHSDADFFIAVRDGVEVGRLSVLENRNYNRYHDRRAAFFYHFECVDDEAVAVGLFERAFEWARARGLTEIIGPKGMGVFDGMGLLVDGFQHRPAMTMMLYNPPYYPRLVEAAGFVKEVDFVSCRLNADSFVLPDRVHRIAEKVMQRGNLRVVTFRRTRDLRAVADKLGRTYNEAFVDNWEYVPISDRELKMVVDDLLTIADPKLMKVIMHQDDVVGFLFAFPDLSAALQRCRGRLLPFGAIDLLREYRRTDSLVLNGAGILPRFHGRGGNALLYSEMESTVRQAGYRHADLTQIAETAVQMQRDLVRLGAEPYKNHRVYRRAL